MLLTTPPSSTTTWLAPAGWIHRFLHMPLSRQLTWVWLAGLSMFILVSAVGLAEYKLVRERQKVVAELAVSGALAGMQQYLDQALRHEDEYLVRAAELYAAHNATKAADRQGTVQSIASGDLHSFAILRADGKPDPLGQALDLEQRRVAAPHFAEHQRRDSGQLMVSDVTRNSQNGSNTIQLSRRMNTVDGGFQGVILTHFDLSNTEQFFLSLRFMGESESLLMRPDGNILLRFTDDGLSHGAQDRSTLLSQLKLAAELGRSAFSAAGSDGVLRLYVWRKLPGNDLFVAKGVSHAGIAKMAQPVIYLIGTLVLLVGMMLLFATGWLHLYVRQVNVNMNERRLAEDAMRRNDERLNWALIGSDSAEWEMQLPEGRLYLSKRFATNLGYPEGDRYLDQTEWLAFVHPADLGTVTTLLMSNRHGGQDGQTWVFRALRAPGSYRWLAVRGRVSQSDEAGQPRTLTGLVRDVTEQHLAREQVQDRTAQLDAIFRLSPDGFVTFDTRHQLKYVNPAFTKLTGWDAANEKGMSEDLFSERLGQLCLADRPFRSLATLREEAKTTADVVSDLIELAGTPRRIMRVSLKLSHAPTVSQILYFRDVTHETIVEDMKTEFLATAAHELRTPMASVVGFSEILCTHPLQPQEHLEFANIIWRQSLHLAGILDELLDLSRIESRGGKGLVLQTVDLGAQVDQVISGFVLPKGRAAPLSLVPSLPCRADVGKVQQVIGNVLSNAYKFSGDGTAVTITQAEPAMHPVSGRACVGIVVRDAGIGMSSAQLARVYERFYRADKTGAIPGNGLGLSITKEIMGLLDGQIDITSVSGKGTTVTLWFPKADAPLINPPAMVAAA